MISLLVNIAVFSAGGVVLNVALQGLMLVLFGRGSGMLPRALLSGGAALVLVAVPVLAAITLLRGQPDSGPAWAFTAALCVALLIFGSSAAVSALASRGSSPGTTARAWTPGGYLSGLGVCFLVGLVGAGAALLVV